MENRRFFFYIRVGTAAQIDDEYERGNHEDHMAKRGCQLLLTVTGSPAMATQLAAARSAHHWAPLSISP